MNCAILSATVLFARIFVTESTDTCAEMRQLCTDYDGTELTMETATTIPYDEGSDFDCINSWFLGPGQSVGSWHYFTVAATSAAGAELKLEIVSLDNSFIDYVMWGPYASADDAIGNCGNLVDVVDCQFGTLNTEYPTVAPANPGEVYVILLIKVTAFDSADFSPVGLLSLKVVSDAFIEDICGTSTGAPGACVAYGLTLTKKDGSPHECSCEATCEGYFCNKVGFVEEKLGAAANPGTCGEFETCCCNCPNCD